MIKRGVVSVVGLALAAATAFGSVASAADASGRNILNCQGRKGAYVFGIIDQPQTLEMWNGSEWTNYFDGIENIAGSVYSTYDFAKTEAGYKFDRVETSRTNGRVYQTYEVRFDTKANTFSMTPSGILALNEGIADQGACKPGTVADLK